MSKHTPTPWHVEPLEGDPNGIAICAANIGIVATILRPADEGLCDADHADAAYIVNSANLFPQLAGLVAEYCKVAEDYESGGFKRLPDEQAIFVKMQAMLVRLSCFKLVGIDRREKFIDAHGGYWTGEHPDYPTEDWHNKIAENESRLGYWDWVISEIESNGGSLS
jgi:hypothetical protein